MPESRWPRGLLLACCAAAVVVASVPAHAADADWRFVPAPANVGVAGRAFGVAAGLPGGTEIVVTGGEVPALDDSDPIVLADTWTFDGETWTPHCGTAGLAPCPIGSRVFAGMGTGPEGAVLFGGMDDDPDAPGVDLLGDTWVFDGTEWVQRCGPPSCGPPARIFHAMAGNGEQVVLFSGADGTGQLDDTWTFDGATWTQVCGSSISLPCGPPARGAGTMTWDGSQFVLFGGGDIGSGSAPFDDTWTFDGAMWTQVCGSSISAPCGPAGRALAGGSFFQAPTDGQSGAVIAGGGDLFTAGDTTLLRDAWIFRAGSWTELAVPWESSPAVFPADGNPPPTTAPLLPLLGPLTTTCRVALTAVTITDEPASSPIAFTGGQDLAASGVPSCATGPPPPVPAPPTGSPAEDGTTAPGTLPATGRSSSGPLARVALVCLGAGVLLVGLARRRPGRV